eukprot:CAMPEP_0118680996 /NCGR_PEP_ID=MMETSP0800-20121206/4689_1 /TAXON_ID=210618 ORGANISM="Striatella unipunctata, Strain CCMP2910" /NCGR_SAMPLE_ID=MMETSP0800 /ASSEMBLY_ACC=CAM_ASM_000638 /LENGTH=190 /DNA_ID=CAMNT_0006577235 /DNA_START=436 /DNA_END=1010 /DNA_ORIENTATION=+
MEEQDILGWTTFMRGYWAKMGTNTPEHNKPEGENKVDNVLDRNGLQTIGNMLDPTNQKAQTEDSKVLRQAREEAKNRMKEAYNTKEVHRASNRALYRIPLETRLARPLEEQERWLQMINDIRTQDSQREQGQQTIQQYFNTILTTNRTQAQDQSPEHKYNDETTLNTKTKRMNGNDAVPPPKGQGDYVDL